MALKPANPAGFTRLAVLSKTHPLLFDLALLALLRLLAGLFVFALGFRAVSDDDFARVVIAQEWAGSPKLDPTGTSWLPLPFWITGIAMRAVSADPWVAYGVAAFQGILSTFLIHRAALWITEHRRISLAGAALATVLPWSARLGIATVPELLASALALVAISAVCAPKPIGFPIVNSSAAAFPPAHRMLVGAACLAASTLCRYDAWPIALAFALVALLCAAAPKRPSRVRYALSALMALVSPALWIAWNYRAHGSATHFLERVAAYKRALSAQDTIHPFRVLVAYPEAFIRHEPELFGALLLVTIVLIFSRRARPAHLSAHLGRYYRPAAFFVLQLALLSAAMVRDGAPTHHPERALLSGMLLLSLLAAELGFRLRAHLLTLARPLAFPLILRTLQATLLAWLIFAAGWLRPWSRREHFAERSAETQIGHIAKTLTKPGERILIEVVDYGYFAIMAAFTRPRDIVLDKSADPRTEKSPGSIGDPNALRERLQKDRIRYIIARTAQAPTFPPEVPQTPIAQAGPIALFGPIANPTQP